MSIRKKTKINRELLLNWVQSEKIRILTVFYENAREVLNSLVSDFRTYKINRESTNGIR